MKKARYLFLLLCLSGLLYQVQHLCNLYFSYDIITEVSVSFPVSFVPPALSLCFYIPMLIKWNETIEQYPSLLPMLGIFHTNISQIQQDFKQFSAYKELFKTDFLLKKQFQTVGNTFKYTYNATELFAKCSWVNADKYYSIEYDECNNLYDIEPAITDPFMCFAFSHKQDVTYNYLRNQRMSGLPGYLSAVFLSNTSLMAADEFILFYHPTRTLSRHGFTRYVYVREINRMITLSYAIFENYLLPPPFSTRCRDYTKSGFEDKADCFEFCVNKESFKRYKTLFPGPRIIANHSDEVLLSAVDLMLDHSLAEGLQKIESDCDRICWQKDCEEQQYLPILQTTTPYKYAAITTFSEQQPTITSTYQQKVSFIQFATDLCSAFGFCKYLFIMQKLVTNQFCHHRARNVHIQRL